MKASELISSVRENYSQLSLKPNNDDSAIIVEKNDERVFYFSISQESDEEIKKQLVGYLSIDWRKRKTDMQATIDGQKAVISAEFPLSGLQVRATL
ncbi:MAG: hypothetical protein AAB842_02385 [Patescibacteria group bacterium]